MVSMSCWTSNRSALGFGSVAMMSSMFRPMNDSGWVAKVRFRVGLAGLSSKLNGGLTTLVSKFEPGNGPGSPTTGTKALLVAGMTFEP